MFLFLLYSMQQYVVWLHIAGRKGTIMDAILESEHKGIRVSWGETAVGVLPVATLCLAITLEGSGSVFSWLWIWGAFGLLFALPAVGILKAIESGFPRWSAPYFGLAALNAWLIYAIFTQRLFPWPWLDWVMRAAILLLVGYFFLGLVRILRRRPAGGETDGGQEMGMLFFCAHTFAPLVMLLAFDEIAVAAKALMILVGAVILVLGGVVYMRARNRGVGAAALAVSALGVWGYANAAAWLYWRGVGWG